ncbi:hypothetical protein AMTRI_Chr10g2720 [Amborella trichopoda]
MVIFKESHSMVEQLRPIFHGIFSKYSQLFMSHREVWHCCIYSYLRMSIFVFQISEATKSYCRFGLPLFLAGSASLYELCTCIMGKIPSAHPNHNIHQIKFRNGSEPPKPVGWFFRFFLIEKIKKNRDKQVGTKAKLEGVNGPVHHRFQSGQKKF